MTSSEAPRARAATREVLHHLGGHRLGKGRYPFGGDTVIAREYRDVHLIHTGLRRALQGGELNGDRFQPAKCAGRLGELRLPRFGGLARAGIGQRRRDGQPVDGCTFIDSGIHAGSPFKVWGRPATVRITRSQICARS